MAAGKYVVLGISADKTKNGGVAVDYAYKSAFTLSNSSDEIIVLDVKGRLVDKIEYSKTKFWPLAAGVAASFRHPTNTAGFTNDVAGNWCKEKAAWSGSKGDKGSPGAAPNCVPKPDLGPPKDMGAIDAGPTVDAGAPGDAGPAADLGTSTIKLVISEYMANPSKVADSAGEYFEMYNAGSAQVDLKGFTIKDDGSNKHVIKSSVLVGAGKYVVLGISTDKTKNGGVAVDYAYGSAYNLSNSSDEIVVLDTKGAQVDRVVYDKAKKWPLGSGVSSSFRFPADASKDNNLAANWCSEKAAWTGSSGDKGSPGAAPGC